MVVTTLLNPPADGGGGLVFHKMNEYTEICVMSLNRMSMSLNSTTPLRFGL